MIYWKKRFADLLLPANKNQFVPQSQAKRVWSNHYDWLFLCFS